MKYQILCTVLLAILFVIAGCEKGEPLSTPAPVIEQPESSPELQEFDKGFHKKAITVMTRNIYVGANVDCVLSVQNPAEIPIKVAQAFQMLQATNFPERAKALANEVLLTRPDLIGLQEVSLIRIQSPGDAIMGGTVPADSVLYDYLDILMNALSAKGLNYSVAGIIQNADIEVPMLVNPNPPAFDDVRLTDYDVVLARHGIQVSNIQTANYQVFLSIPIGNFQLDIPRGYVALDAKVGDKTYRFANTHLEAFGEPIRLAQAQELVASLQNEANPIIMVGDFNDEAGSGSTYQYLVSQDYVDSWTENLIPFDPDGYTFGHDDDLMNPTANFTRRIDFIFAKSHVWHHNKRFIGPVFGIVVGDEYRNRTASGLWPSDHGGVAARLRIPENPL